MGRRPALDRRQPEPPDACATHATLQAAARRRGGENSGAFECARAAPDPPQRGSRTAASAKDERTMQRLH